MHGLETYPGTGRCRRRRIQRAQKHLRLVKKQRRHGLVVPLRPRIYFRLQERPSKAHKQRRARPLREKQNKHLGIRGHEQLREGPGELACWPPHAEASRAGQRCCPRLLETRRHHSRCIRRERHDSPRSRKDRPPGVWPRVRSSLCRSYHQTI